MRVRGCDRRFKVHKSKIGLLKYVSHIGEQRAPALAVGGVSGGIGGCCRCSNRLMRNHIAPNRESHFGKLMRIWRN